MKTLLIARHAKSSWNDASKNDFERGLNPRGQKDAPLMASYLQQCGYMVNQIISSDAVRALETAEQYKKYLTPEHDLITYHDLYLAPLNSIIQLVKNIPQSEAVVMLVGHNPGMSEALNYWSGENMDDMPTCGVGIIQFDINSWAEAEASQGSLLGFEHPKSIQDKSH